MSAVPVPREELIQRAVTLYRSVFGGSLPTHAACAPGRVNLIGEHTDYNNGYVFPMALPNITVVVGAKNGGDSITIFSEGVKPAEQHVTFPLPSNTQLERGAPGWANYVKGVVSFFSAATVPGFNAVYLTSVPIGGGLSSSAAIEVATFTFLEALTGTKVERKEKALTCQKAEHVFALMPCGIMDQYISIFGEEGKALLLDCQDMSHQLVQFQDRDVCILITNSNFKHQLDGSEYPLRAAQCANAAKIMAVPNLRDASLQILEKSRPKMDDGTFKRARHVITEISRTYEAAQALRQKDYSSFGCLMHQSHCSLRDDFQVSTPELDELVDIAMKCNGVYGSRLTGAGFGGSTVTLVRTEAVTEVIDALKKGTLKNLTFHIGSPSDGATNLTSVLHEVLSACSLSTKKSTMTQTKSLVK